MSGLAVSSFVVALVLALLSAMSGIWILAVPPLLLGIYAMVRVDPAKRRGRGFAIWALVIALAMGSCSWMGNHQMRTMVGEINATILGILAFEDDAEQRTKSLRAWAWPKALEKDPDLVSTWQQRYAKVVEEFGTWQEDVDLGSSLWGPMPLFAPPEGVVEVGTEDKRPEGWTLGSVLWTRASFERGAVYLAIVVEDGDGSVLELIQSYQPNKVAPHIGDLRFYRDP